MKSPRVENGGHLLESQSSYTQKHLLLDQDLKEVLNISTTHSQLTYTSQRTKSLETKTAHFHQKFLSADLTFDLRQQEPIGNGRRYCKIQYNGTGTGSYPLPVEVPSSVLLGVGARSRCRCSRHSVKNYLNKYQTSI